MTVLDPSLTCLEAEFSSYQNPAQLDAEIIPFPLNQELILGGYDGSTIYGLGKTALKSNEWVGAVRCGGSHFIFTGLQRISGSYIEVITKQLVIADELCIDNPGFTVSLEDDIEQTRQVVGEYLFPDRSVVDYVRLGCVMDWTTGKRPIIHPDLNGMHVHPDTRKHTIEVISALVSLS